MIKSCTIVSQNCSKAENVTAGYALSPNALDTYLLNQSTWFKSEHNSSSQISVSQFSSRILSTATKQLLAPSSSNYNTSTNKNLPDPMGRVPTWSKLSQHWLNWCAVLRSTLQEAASVSTALLRLTGGVSTRRRATFITRTTVLRLGVGANLQQGRTSMTLAFILNRKRKRRITNSVAVWRIYGDT